MSPALRWERARSFFPVTKELVYLDHARIAPVSARALEALARYGWEASRRGGFDDEAAVRGEGERVRGRAAALLGARPDEVAFVGGTHEGLARVADGIPWRRGDRIVSCALEPPATLATFRSLRARGVELRVLPARGGALPLDSVRRALESPRVRLLLLSSVAPGTGARAELEALGALCRERGVLLCVDASQSLGCLPLDAGACGLDFAVAPAHKWLLSVEGCALFFCSRRVSDLLAPEGEAGDAGARRFDAAPNPAAVFALGAAIDLILEVGVEAIAARVLALCDRLAAGLQERGAELATARLPEAASGIVCFSLTSEPPARTVARLRARKIAVSERDGAVRVSPHFYTSEGEIDAFLDAVR